MPLPGTPVIHPRLLTALGGVAESAQAGTCELLTHDSTPGALDPDSLTYGSDEPTVIWTGPCRFQPKARATANVVQAGDRPVTLADNQVSIPITAPTPRVGDLLRMLTSSDPNISGREFTIVNVAFGDLQAERHLTVQDNETHQGPS